MNTKLILTTIQDHLKQQGIGTTFLTNPSQQFGHGPHLLIHHPHQIIYIKIRDNNCQIHHWQDPPERQHPKPPHTHTLTHHPHAQSNTHQTPLADPELYQRITQHLRKILQD